MDLLTMKNFPVIPLYCDQEIRFLQKDVIGMEINTINLLFLKTVSKNSA